MSNNARSLRGSAPVRGVPAHPALALRDRHRCESLPGALPGLRDPLSEQTSSTGCKGGSSLGALTTLDGALRDITLNSSARSLTRP